MSGLELILAVLEEGLVGGIKNILTIAVIVIPLMVLLELAKDLNILAKINKLFYPIAKIFKISSEATFPLLVGLVFGISYGAGVIIQYAREGRLTGRELIIVNTFLAVAHALVEDTMLFVVVGASGTMLVVSRLVLAVLITIIVARLITEEEGHQYLLKHYKKTGHYN